VRAPTWSPALPRAGGGQDRRLTRLPAQR
jgi:hypothetical protein